MYIEDYIAKKATDKALKDHFNKNKASFSKEEIKASHILVDNEAKAKEVLAAVKKKGADFGALAKEHSTGPTGPNGGDLGWFGRGRMVPEFEEAAFKTKAGQIHDNIVKTRFGYHIIKVDEKKGEGEVKFDDVKTNVEAQLKQELRQNLSEQLDKDAKIEIDAKALSAMKLN
jgi:parvulin-like peptidyl-prolyl isomerase